jgi:hypothetical protein
MIKSYLKDESQTSKDNNTASTNVVAPEYVNIMEGVNIKSRNPNISQNG